MKNRSDSYVGTVWGPYEILAHHPVVEATKQSVKVINAASKDRKYRVTVRARGPIDGYKYGYGGYLKLAGGSRFDVYIHEIR